MRHAIHPDGTTVVLKLLRTSSKELPLLEFLCSLKSQYNHTIPLLETFNLSIGTFIVLPEATPLDLGFRFGLFRTKVADFGRQLIEGVAFLHQHGVAHLDIKPSNIVIAHKGHLYIIDFDISVRVDGPDTLIDKWCGTPSWMAPEIGDRHGPKCFYSPIRADLWSCGLMLLYIAQECEEGDEELKILAGLLLNKNPRLRPMLNSFLGTTTPFLGDRPGGLKRKANAFFLPQAKRQAIDPMGM
jgi:serine/threonine protein kinase